MSLNDDVFDDDLNSVNNDNLLFAEDTELIKEDEIASLESIANSFKIICDESNNFTLALSLQDKLKTNESINRQDASKINQVFGNFFNDSISLEHFTECASLTNYNESLRFINRSLSLESDNIRTNMDTFVTEPINKLKNMLFDISDKYLPHLNHLLDEVMFTGKNIMQPNYVFKNSYIMYDGKITDILTLNISEFDASKVSNDKDEVIFDNKAMNISIANIKRLLEFNIFKVFIFTVLNDNDVSQVLSKNNYALYSTQSLTIDNFIKFLKKFNNVDIIDNIKSEVASLSNSLDKDLETYSDKSASIDNNSDINLIILELEPNMSEIIEKVKLITIINYTLGRFLLNSEVVLKELKKL